MMENPEPRGTPRPGGEMRQHDGFVVSIVVGPYRSGNLGEVFFSKNCCPSRTVKIFAKIDRRAGGLGPSTKMRQVFCRPRSQFPCRLPVRRFATSGVRPRSATMA